MNNREELEKILNLAIGREDGAHKFYLTLAKKTQNSSVREMFAELAAEELNHKSMLLGLKSDPQLELKIIPPPGDFHIAATEEAPELSETMTPKEAVTLAMKKEQQAVDLYSTLAGSAKAVEIRRLFENLANMELGHKKKLEAIFIDVGYPEVF